MDIYSYLNSPDVAEHCRKLNYQFNALETAFIIDDCQSISIEEKHRLYREIIETMSDMEYPCYYYRSSKSKCLSPYKNLFHVLNDRIEREQQCLNLLYGGKDHAVYYVSCNSERLISFARHEGPFSSYERALREICSLRDLYRSGWSYRIEMRFPDSDEYITAHLLNDKNEVFLLECYFDENLLSRHGIDIWVYIPTPFQKGDIVCSLSNRTERWDISPFVLTDVFDPKDDRKRINHMEQYGSKRDMQFYGYELDRFGHIDENSIGLYHDLVYYRGKLKNASGAPPRDKLLLKAISAYLKEEISLHMLLNANDAIHAGRQWEFSFPGWGLDEEDYEKAGIDDDWALYDLVKGPVGLVD